MKKDFDVMEACAASALDFIDTVMFCMKDDGFEDDVINDYKEYLLDAYKVHYDTDIGEQGENITKYLDECNSYDKEAFEEKLTLLQKEEHKIEKWLKKNGYTTDECIGAAFEPVEGRQGRCMDFEYNGNVDRLDVNRLATVIANNVIDDRFSVRVFVYDDEAGEAYKNLFCVEIWLDD